MYMYMYMYNIIHVNYVDYLILIEALQIFPLLRECTFCRYDCVWGVWKRISQSLSMFTSLSEKHPKSIWSHAHVRTGWQVVFWPLPPFRQSTDDRDTLTHGQPMNLWTWSRERSNSRHAQWQSIWSSIAVWWVYVSPVNCLQYTLVWSERQDLSCLCVQVLMYIMHT